MNAALLELADAGYRPADAAALFDVAQDAASVIVRRLRDRSGQAQLDVAHVVVQLVSEQLTAVQLAQLQLELRT